MRALDLDAVSAFVLVADLRSFTRAAEAQGTTQSAVSLKIKRLEDRLGRRLIERTPRLVRLSADGQGFLERARELIAAHERAVSGDTIVRRLSFGISDHAAGPDLSTLIARVSEHDPNLRLEVHIGTSSDMLAAFDRGAHDAVIVRRESARRDGETLLRDRFGWFAAPTFRHRAGEPLRLATLSESCGVRALAVRALDSAAVPWVEAFVGGGVAAVVAAVMSGLAVAPLARRVAPAGAVDIGPRIPLPGLGASEVVLYSRVSDPHLVAAVRVMAASFRSASR